MNISENAYSFLKIEITDEIHIFKGLFMNGNCSLRMYSMCEKVSRLNTKTITVEKCLDHSEVKITTKIMGEVVCDICRNRLEKSYIEYLY